MVRVRKSDLQKYYEKKYYNEIENLKNQLSKRNEEITKLLESNERLESKIKILQSRPSFTPKKYKIKQFKPNLETIKESVPVTVKDLVKNYEKNIIKPSTAPPPLVATKIVTQQRLEPRVEEIPIPSDNLFIDEKKPEMVKSAFKKTQKRYKIKSTYINSLLSELTINKDAVENVLKENLKVMKALKFNRGLNITFEKIKDDYTKEEINQTLWSVPQVLTNESQIDKTMQLAGDSLSTRAHHFLRQGSNWRVRSINFQYIDILVYKPLEASSYIKLPPELQNARKGLINIKNKDQKCFLYCLLYHLNKDKIKKNPQRVSGYKQYENTVDFTGINFPVAIKDIPKIEENNNISVNVFGYESKSTFPIYLSSKQSETPLNLLLISDEVTFNQHYVYIKDFDRFMYNKTSHHNKKHFCMFCLQSFCTLDILNEHKNNCLEINKKQNIIMPKPESKVYFRNYHKMLKCPFVIYCDFESILEPISTVKSDKTTSYSVEYQHHQVCSYAYKVVCQDSQYTKPLRLYRGENAVFIFLENLLKENKEIQEVIKTQFHKKIKMSKEQEEEFQRSTNCHICGGNLMNQKGKTVRDHCHITGEYRGPAHEICNLQLVISTRVPVIFHNLKGYDSHFIMQEIGKFNLNINVIPTNSEKYMSFMWGKNLVFIDSFQFMASSLQKLASNLPSSKYIHLEEEFNSSIQLLKQKGVYCYEYMDSFEKFCEPQLPAQEKFYSSLNNTQISDEDYKRALEIYSQFNCKNIGEYSDLYLKSDVCLLADVFENFRDVCLLYYKLDPAHYFSSPGLAWDAMLKMTGVKLDLISDINMENMIQMGMRGGISTIIHRHEKANNKYMKDYDPDKESSYLMYLDANNLYGWAMCQKLPIGNFKWKNNFKMSDYADSSDKGCIIECDLEYPSSLHDLHNMYPLAPEKILVTDDMLSPYCKQIFNDFNLKNSICKKLIPNLNSKQKYVLHYKNLQLYLSLGLVLKKIHRVLEFKQESWLKDYIDFNTEKRKNAASAFEKDFFKLMNNSVFGKTMENLRNRCSIKLVTTREQFLKWAAKPTFQRSVIFNENLTAIHRIKESLKLNKPSYVGMCILDLSKTLMYDFHYNYILKKYNPESIKLLFTDTDSLCYHLKTEDAYKDFFKDKELFDNSDYDPNSQFYFKENKKVIGKMKDECGGIPIIEFCGLRSKMYSYIKENSLKKCCKAKGIKKNVVEKEIKHNNYIETLFNKSINLYKMNIIRSEKHILNTYEVNKIGLSCYDDKRYILDDGITTLAYGNYNINNNY